MKNFIFASLIFLITLNACATGRREVTRNQEEFPANAITFTGRVVIYGSHPITYVGITDENGLSYGIIPRERGEELRILQGRVVEFTIVPLEESERAAALAYEESYLPGGPVRLLSHRVIR